MNDALIEKGRLLYGLTEENYALLENTSLRIAGFQHESIVDGVGVRTTVFFQGCEFNCKGCHNQSTHDLSAGTLVSGLDVYKEIYESKLAKGVTFSGGEPFLQEEALRNITKVLHEAGRHITIYTGHEFNELLNAEREEEKILLRKEIIDNYANTLITGRFILSKRTLEIPYIGSSNQEIHNLR